VVVELFEAHHEHLCQVEISPNQRGRCLSACCVCLSVCL
jgi:hypothetical protein